MSRPPIYFTGLAAAARWHNRVKRLGGPSARCERCGEAHPFALTRDEDGTVRCYLCRALERGVPAVERDPSEGEARACGFCGFQVPEGLRVSALLELHHIAGRNHDAHSVVPLCLNCHAKVHEVLRDVGVDLRRQSDPRDTEMNAALAEFSFVLLAWEEAPDLRDSAPFVILYFLSVVLFVHRVSSLVAGRCSSWSS